MTGNTAINCTIKVRIKKTVSVLIMLCVILPAIGIAFPCVDAEAAASVSEINRLKRERAEYTKQKEEINAKIDTIEFERMAELDRKKILDDRLMLTGAEIDNLKETINQYNILISEKEYEIIIAQNRQEEQLRRYKARVRDMEENGLLSYFEVIFGSTSYIDFLARLDFIAGIMEAEENNYHALQQARIETEEVMSGLDIIKAELDAEQEKMEQLENELQKQLAEALALLEKMESDLETERRLYEIVKEEEDRVQREIKAAEDALRRQREQERQRQLAEQRAAGAASGTGGSSGTSGTSGTPQVTGTGELMWPVGGNGGKVISSYGMRSGRMHQGVDIGAAHGTAVVASDSGTVTTSSYGSGYGNYVVITHNNGMTTLYAHLSTRSVSRGDTVSKGQQIGLVGQSGNANTPHLHFEVSVDGSRVNPINKL